MNWDSMEGEWKRRRGTATHLWGRVMKDELAETAGKYEELVGRLQLKFGIAVEKSIHEADRFTKIIGQLRKSNTRLMRLQSCHKNVKPSHWRSTSPSSTGKTPRSQRHR
jgi:uncharacterized protein YjbJ (UPF0337 family)